MSDTPETDNERTLKLALEVFTQLANHLKQERDEARRKLEDLDVAAIHSCHDQCQRPMCVLRRERDEARELAQQMSESNQVLMADVRFYRNAWEQLKEGAK
jgi:hypothetical protein